MTTSSREDLVAQGMQRIQEVAHGPDRDYRVGSPHLSHWTLVDRLGGLLRQTIKAIRDAGLPPSILEVGAGHGGYTEPMLASGCCVTATEMSRFSLVRLEELYGHNSNFRCVFDLDGSLEVLGAERFSFVLASSVLHHIPDYEAFVEGPVLDHLLEGGAFLSFQDPLWYPSMSAVVHRLDRAFYFAWRLPRGHYRQGVSAISRRLRGQLDDRSPSDMVEYHVMRNGVNQDVLLDLLSPRFRSVEIVTYWSSHSRLFQRVGELCRIRNTFLLRATGFRG